MYSGITAVMKKRLCVCVPFIYFLYSFWSKMPLEERASLSVYGRARVERSPEPEGQPVLECLLEVTSLLGWKLEALQSVNCWRWVQLGHPVEGHARWWVWNDVSLVDNLSCSPVCLAVINSIALRFSRSYTNFAQFNSRFYLILCYYGRLYKNILLQQGV